VNATEATYGTGGTTTLTTTCTPGGRFAHDLHDCYHGEFSVLMVGPCGCPLPDKGA
jgi:hypothetical protein